MFSDPKRNVEQLGLTPGMKVVDMGAGSGFYTLAAAELVGGSGRVYAVDIQKELLDRIKNEAAKRRLTNIEAIWGDIEKAGGTKLQAGIADAVIVSNVLFQIEQKAVFVDEIKRILKPKREVLIVDWTDSFGGMGPDGKSIVTEEAAKQLFESHGFMLTRSIRPGDHHYGLIFSKK